MKLFTLFLSLSALSLALAEPHNFANSHRHRDIAQRSKGDVQLHRRFDSARWTFYDVGLGACGKTNVPSDFIVALNSAQFGGGFPGPHCFQTITMSYNGKTTQATIMDECPGCPYGGLDLSRGLFDFFASESLGVLYGTWSFGGGGGGGGDTPTPSPTPEPKPKPKPQPTTTTPTTTWTPPPSTTPTSTQYKTPSSSSSSSSLNYSSSSSTTSHSTSKTYSSVTTSSTSSVTPTPSGVQNLDGISQVVLDLAGIVLAGENVA